MLDNVNGILYKADQNYFELLNTVLNHGVAKDDRTGTGTLSTFGQYKRFNISKDQIPLLTTKEVSLHNIIHELLWMLSGDTNIRYLKEHRVGIWDSWVKPGTEVYANLSDEEIIAAITKQPGSLPVQFLKSDQIESGEYQLEVVDRGDDEGNVSSVTVVSYSDSLGLQKGYQDHFGRPAIKLVAGELPKIYQHQWRHWEDVRFSHDPEMSDDLISKGYRYIGSLDTDGSEVYRREIDQLQVVIDQLRTNPDDRGIILTAWNVAQLDEMALRPCHTFAQFWTRPLRPYERKKLLDRKLESESIRYWDEQLETFEGYLTSVGIPERELSCLLYMRKPYCALSM